MEKKPGKPALGKGLSALIPDVPEPPRAVALEADINALTPNQLQPRGHMDDDRLNELAESIRSTGVIQPIVVRKVGEGYQIIAGERRWRAARKAGLKKVPIAIKEVAPGQDQHILEMALIENIQRENLNPIEEALAYRRLADQFELTQEDIATRVGKDRATVANILRLLKLPDEVKAEVATGRLSMGHARALLALSTADAQRNLSRDTLNRNLSVREVEAAVRKLVTPVPVPEDAPKKKPIDPNTRDAEEKLRFALGTRVRIVRKGTKGTKGRVEIEFASEDELIRIYDRLIDNE